MRADTKAAAAELLRVADVGSLAFADWHGDSLSEMLNQRAGTHEPVACAVGDGPHGAPFMLCTAPDWLYTMDYLYHSSPCYWVMIPPSAWRLLKSHLRCVRLNMYTGDFTGAPCSQFVHHLQLSVLLQKLRRWRVTFTVVRQEPGDVMVLIPSAYYQLGDGRHGVGARILRRRVEPATLRWLRQLLLGLLQKCGLLGCALQSHAAQA
jgi:hypothetical protein